MRIRRRSSRNGRYLPGAGRERVVGLRLEPDDVDGRLGQGAPVRSSAVALLLAVPGRPVGPDQLTGDGAELLVARR